MLLDFEQRTKKMHQLVKHLTPALFLFLMTAGCDGPFQRPEFRNAKIANQRELALSQLKTIYQATLKFKEKTGAYPEQIRDLFQRPQEIPRDSWDGPYLSGGIPRDPWGNEYVLENLSDKKKP